MNNELYHYGVKGMKWGVRRYQNKDGTLTARGKKKISKQYLKVSDQAVQEFNSLRSKMELDAYNKTANRMNNGEIDRFNAAQRKKYGDNFSKRDGYVQDYMSLFDKLYVENLNKSLNDFYVSNASVKKAHELVKRYDMTSWDELARDNEAKIEEVKRLVASYT